MSRLTSTRLAKEEEREICKCRNRTLFSDNGFVQKNIPKGTFYGSIALLASKSLTLKE